MPTSTLPLPPLINVTVQSVIIESALYIILCSSYTYHFVKGLLKHATYKLQIVFIIGWYSICTLSCLPLILEECEDEEEETIKS